MYQTELYNESLLHGYDIAKRILLHQRLFSVSRPSNLESSYYVPDSNMPPLPIGWVAMNIVKLKNFILTSLSRLTASIHEIVTDSSLSSASSYALIDIDNLGHGITITAWIFMDPGAPTFHFYKPF
jgi:hypothetical protein